MTGCTMASKRAATCWARMGLSMIKLEVHRSLIEVHGADEQPLAIEYEQLGVQGIIAMARDRCRLAAASRIAEQ